MTEDILYIIDCLNEIATTGKTLIDKNGFRHLQKALMVMERGENGCDYCKKDSEGYVRMFGAFALHHGTFGEQRNNVYLHCGRKVKSRQINFCPMCGRDLRRKNDD